MEAPLSAIRMMGRCREYECHFTSKRRVHQQHHVEGHNILYVCSCGCFSSYRDTTTKHSRPRHWHEWTPAIQVDECHWPTIRDFISNLPEKILLLPVRGNDPAVDCKPDLRPAPSERALSMPALVPSVAAAAIAQPGPAISEPKRKKEYEGDGTHTGDIRTKVVRPDTVVQHGGQY